MALFAVRELLTQIEGRRKGQSGGNMRATGSEGRRPIAMKEMPSNIGLFEFFGDGGRWRMKAGEGGLGALGEIRTPDPRNRNPMLYPAELRVRVVFQWVSRGANFLGHFQGTSTPTKNNSVGFDYQTC